MVYSGIIINPQLEFHFKYLHTVTAETFNANAMSRIDWPFDRSACTWRFSSLHGLPIFSPALRFLSIAIKRLMFAISFRSAMNDAGYSCLQCGQYFPQVPLILFPNLLYRLACYVLHVTDRICISEERGMIARFRILCIIVFADYLFKRLNEFGDAVLGFK